MICNIGKFDKMIRRSIGLIIMGLGFYYKSWIGIIGLVPIAMTYLSFCPIYVPLKINTKEKEEENVGNN